MNTLQTNDYELFHPSIVNDVYRELYRSYVYIIREVEMSIYNGYGHSRPVILDELLDFNPEIVVMNTFFQNEELKTHHDKLDRQEQEHLFWDICGSFDAQPELEHDVMLILNEKRLAYINNEWEFINNPQQPIW